MGPQKYYSDKLTFEMDPTDLYEALENDKSIVVIDARNKESYEREHIPGAISFPHKTMNKVTTTQLEKDKLYVIYCDGIGCNASTKGAFKLAELGFNVKELIGGIEWWKKDNYKTEGGLPSPIQASIIGCNC